MICRIRHSKLLRGTVFITTALTLFAGCCGEDFPGAKDIVAIAISPLNSSIQAGEHSAILGYGKLWPGRYRRCYIAGDVDLLRSRTSPASGTPAWQPASHTER